ncbi:hypothetical protein OEB99_15290 [Actinotalea sp. M2MS4P-6]|uniref:hypothetical protein n=1 Tax=Actinotalea sp. M2MS4P-6 TaxID=2983762 RepID=UPI0021E468A0|nr:hypothetical protein [Actinotalea sp. M2MS4P-6]MCV2395678.1 hypothetical protein [Actinotalea sp. M2MS4P-6]
MNRTLVATALGAVLLTGGATGAGAALDPSAATVPHRIGVVLPAQSEGAAEYAAALQAAALDDGLQVVTLPADTQVDQQRQAWSLMALGVSGIVVLPVTGDGTDITDVATEAGTPAVVAGQDAEADLTVLLETVAATA